MEAARESVYSPWMLEFQRIDLILRNLHDAYIALEPRPQALFRLFNLQRELWRVLRPKTAFKKNSPLSIEKMDLRFKKLDQSINKFVMEESPIERGKLINSILADIESMYDDLYMIRERVGLGVPMYSTGDNYDLKKKSFTEGALG